MRWRSFVALILLLGYGATAAEAVLGELRDGAVHHESSIEAMAHNQTAQGEHGHEDPGDHDSDHQHGTSVDHCTHTHSASLPAHHEFSLVVLLSTDVHSVELLSSGVAFGSLFHPPKA